MQVKLFSGGDPQVVEAEANAWLAAQAVTVVKTELAIREATVKGTQKPSGRAISRRVPLVVVSVWYEGTAT